jgi:hypothetical protein
MGQMEQLDKPIPPVVDLKRPASHSAHELLPLALL